MAVELYDEHEQSERVRNWLRENGVSILMGVVLALAGIFGWRQWQDYRAEQAALANEYFTVIQQDLQADRLESAAEQFAAMREAAGSNGYVALAGMLLASSQAEAGNNDAAAGILSDLLGGGKWKALEPLIRLRLAQVESARDNAEAGLALLQGDPPTGFEALWYETRGDLLRDLGRLEQAANAYSLAVEQLRGEGSNFRQARTKLDAVRSQAGLAEAS
ncbi:MAG: tetratricopeptide repeat protein [Wenzhouxiangellaceae bacterium]|nr:tetratricopeptide repeat protein [Wenzhouxiangellaceae bacterium]